MQIRTRLAFATVMIAGCAAQTKAPPTDDPQVDDTKADSLRAPSMQPAIAPGGVGGGLVTASTKYLGYPMTMTAGEQVVIWVGGSDDAGGTLDTVAYLYGPKDSHGRRGSYLVRNDDWSNDGYSSRFDFTAPRDGDYLIVATTYTKPDPGTVYLSTYCATCFTGFVAHAPGSAYAAPIDGRTFVDPELATARTLDDTLAILDRDAQDGDPLVIASDAVNLWGGRKWPLDVKDRVDQAVHAALPTVEGFAQWPDGPASVVLTDAYLWQPAPADDNPAFDDVAAELQSTLPGSTIQSVGAEALTSQGQTYGYHVTVNLQQPDGSVYSGNEYFAPDHHFLGDAGGGYEDSGD